MGSRPSVKALLCSVCWICSLPHTDEGENGLGRFDKVIELAEKKGVKLLLPLANNWADYGGYVSCFACIETCRDLKPSACRPGWICTPSTLAASTTMTYVSFIIPWHKGAHPNRMNAVLQEPQNQGRFQGIHQSCGDPVQELSGDIRLGNQ